MKGIIRVVLVDDHSIVRAGLKRILEESRDISVVGEAQGGREALVLLREERPHVAVVDLSMPGMDGLEVLGRVHAEMPEIPLIMLTMHNEDQYAVRAVEAGARGFMTKQAAPEALVSAIIKVANGGVYLSEEASEALALHLAKGTQRAFGADLLSMRELQVLRRLALGQTNHEIAEDFCISVKTVDTYRLRILSKLNLRNNVDISRFAMQYNLIE